MFDIQIRSMTEEEFEFARFILYAGKVSLEAGTDGPDHFGI